MWTITQTATEYATLPGMAQSNQRISRFTVAVSCDFSRISGRDFFSGILRFARARSDWNVRIVQSPKELIPFCAAPGHHTGIITSEIGDESLVPALERSSIPTVIAGSYPQGIIRRKTKLSLVRLDDREIGRRGAAFLSGLGKFASYAFIPTAETFNKAMSDLRYAGFKDELAHHRIRSLLYDGKTDQDLDEWIDALKKPAALMLSHDQRAATVFGRRSGHMKRTGQRLSIVSVDNDALICESATPSLTSLEIGTEAEGFAAAKELNRLLHGRTETTGRTIVIRPEIRIVERDSTPFVSPAVHLIESAEEFIRANATRSIGVDDVVTHLRVSRRLLELRFRQYRACSIVTTINDMRLAAFAQRLKSSRLSIAAVARACGFNDPRYLARLFKRRYKLSPKAFRNSQSGR